MLGGTNVLYYYRNRSCIAKTIQTNDDLAQFLDTSHEWIVTRTGIEARHVCVAESILDIALEAM